MGTSAMRPSRPQVERRCTIYNIGSELNVGSRRQTVQEFYKGDEEEARTDSDVPTLACTRLETDGVPELELCQQRRWAWHSVRSLQVWLKDSVNYMYSGDRDKSVQGSNIPLLPLDRGVNSPDGRVDSREHASCAAGFKAMFEAIVCPFANEESCQELWEIEKLKVVFCWRKDLMSEDCTCHHRFWYMGRQVTLFQACVIKNMVSLARKIFEYIVLGKEDKREGRDVVEDADTAQRRKTFNKAQFFRIKSDCRFEQVHNDETILHFAVLHYSATSSNTKKTAPAKYCDMLHFLVDEVLQPDDSVVQDLHVKVDRQLSGALYCYDTEGNIDERLRLGYTPLSMAVSMLMWDATEYLLDKGLKLWQVDSKGNNILHLLAMQTFNGRDEPDMEEREKKKVAHDKALGEMLKNVLEREKTEREKTPGQKRSDSPSLLNARNQDGFKPVHVAAHCGNIELIQHLMKLPDRKVELLSLGRRSMTAYDLTDLETQGPEEDGCRYSCCCTSKEGRAYEQVVSVLQVAKRSSHPNAKLIFDVTPIKELIKLKWQTYGSIGFFWLLLLNIVFLTVLSLVVYFRPLTLSPCPDPDSPEFNQVIQMNFTAPDGSPGIGCTPMRPTPFKYTFRTQGDKFRVAGEILTLIIALLYLYAEVGDFIHLYRYSSCKDRFGKFIFVCRQYMSGSTGRSMLFTILKFLYLALFGVSAYYRVTDGNNQEVFLALLVFFVYIYSFTFARDFKFTGPYLVTIYVILAEVVSRFAVVYMFTLMAFGLCFYVLLQEALPMQPFDYKNYGNTLLTTFRSTLGLTDLELQDVEAAKSSGLVAVLFVLFLIFSVLLLVNFLIAMMGKTQEQLGDDSAVVWRSQLLSSILFVERRLSCLVRLVGRHGNTLYIKDSEHKDQKRYFLCLYETSQHEKVEDAQTDVARQASDAPKLVMDAC